MQTSRGNSRGQRTPPIWTGALLIAALFSAVFAVTAEWDDAAINVDAQAAALPAWALAQHGTLDLTGVAPSNPWIVNGSDGMRLSNRPPGSFLPAVPAYRIFGDRDNFSTDPATGTAVLITAVAMATLYRARLQVVKPSVALVGTALMAFGTATWPISSQQLWPHGTGQLTAGLGVLGIATSRYWTSSTALAAGILVRPPTAVFPAVMGLGLLADPQTRSRWRAFATTATISALGLGALVTYNYFVFGEWSISGGYSTAFAERLTAMSATEYLVNLARMFVLPPNGLLLWSPVILVAVIGIPKAWKAIPRWAKHAALAALIYLLVHARMNRASGGLPFNYRYPLEPLVLAAPLLTVSALRIYESSDWGRRSVVATAMLSVVLQALHVFTLHCEPLSASEVLCRLGF